METKREEMFALIQKWETSGIQQEQFCKEHEVKMSTFGYWRTQYLKHQKKSDPAFVPVEATGSAEDIEVVFPNGVTVRLKECCPKTLATLIHLV